jgi:hypothetical protein
MSHIGNDAVIDAQRDELETEHRNIDCSLGCLPPDINGKPLCGCEPIPCVNCLMFTCDQHN